MARRRRPVGRAEVVHLLVVESFVPSLHVALPRRRRWVEADSVGRYYS